MHLGQALGDVIHAPRRRSPWQEPAPSPLPMRSERPPR
jgi:hypothetical protein